MPLRRLGRQTQIDAKGLDRLELLVNRRLVYRDGLATDVEIFLANAAAGSQFLAAFVVGFRQGQGG